MLEGEELHAARRERFATLEAVGAAQSQELIEQRNHKIQERQSELNETGNSSRPVSSDPSLVPARPRGSVHNLGTRHTGENPCRTTVIVVGSSTLRGGDPDGADPS